VMWSFAGIALAAQRYYRYQSLQPSNGQGE
jgi:hypothetical protein